VRRVISRLSAARSGSWYRGRWQPPVTSVPGARLGTHYPDAAVQEMATEDGGYRFNTPAWGPGNRVLHGLLAVLHSAVTHALAVRLRADQALGEVAAAYEHAREGFRELLTEADTAMAAAGRAEARKIALAQKLADRELGLPTAAWRVLALLALLGVGDLTMTSTAMMVFNISDRPYVSWLPVSALQVAAVPVVVGVLAAAHFLGEAIKAHRCEPRQQPVIKIIALAALGGGLCLSLSVAAIRTSYLTANGVRALTLPFIGIQLGLFLVAVAASAWVAHPYRAEWRQADREAQDAGRVYLAVRHSAAREAANVNKLVREHHSLVAQALDGAEAVLSDGYRQEHIYLRGLQHGQPEPITEELYTGPLHQVDLPGVVHELREYPRVAPGSHLEPLKPVNLDDLDKKWRDLQDQWQRQHELAWQAGERAGHRPAAAPEPSLNGASQTRIPPQPPARDNSAPAAGAS
jgi:hypothetical protein